MHVLPRRSAGLFVFFFIFIFSLHLLLLVKSHVGTGIHVRAAITQLHIALEPRSWVR